MNVNFRHAVTGWPRGMTMQKISALTRQGRVKYYKIGMTADPKRRAREIKHQYGRDYYDEMTVVYRTASRKNEGKMEKMLLGYYEIDPRIVDTGPPGAGRPPQTGGPYYVYVCRKFP